MWYTYIPSLALCCMGLHGAGRDALNDLILGLRSTSHGGRGPGFSNSKSGAIEHTSCGPLAAGPWHVAQRPMESAFPEQAAVNSCHTVVTFVTPIIVVPYSACVYAHTGQIHFVWQ